MVERTLNCNCLAGNNERRQLEFPSTPAAISDKEEPIVNKKSGNFLNFISALIVSFGIMLAVFVMYCFVMVVTAEPLVRYCYVGCTDGPNGMCSLHGYREWKGDIYLGTAPNPEGVIELAHKLNCSINRPEAP